jgi:hypothetical protein
MGVLLHAIVILGVIHIPEIEHNLLGFNNAATTVRTMRS